MPIFSCDHLLLCQALQSLHGDHEGSNQEHNEIPLHPDQPASYQNTHRHGFQHVSFEPVIVG